MDHQVKILRQLRDNLIIFIKELQHILPEDKEELGVLICIVERQLPMHEVVKYFQEYFLPVEDKINNREEEYFLENPILFEKLQADEEKDRVNRFKKIWKQSNPQNQDQIWSWLKFFLDLCKKY